MEGLLMYMVDAGTGVIILMFIILSVHLYGAQDGIHGDFSWQHLLLLQLS